MSTHSKLRYYDALVYFLWAKLGIDILKHYSDGEQIKRIFFMPFANSTLHFAHMSHNLSLDYARTPDKSPYQVISEVFGEINEHTKTDI
jgi:hypothetical protein